MNTTLSVRVLSYETHNYSVCQKYAGGKYRFNSYMTLLLTVRWTLSLCAFVKWEQWVGVFFRLTAHKCSKHSSQLNKNNTPVYSLQKQIPSTFQDNLRTISSTPSLKAYRERCLWRPRQPNLSVLSSGVQGATSVPQTEANGLRVHKELAIFLVSCFLTRT
jgi:hypothetical protein